MNPSSTTSLYASAPRSTRLLSNVRSNAILLLFGTDLSDTNALPPYSAYFFGGQVSERPMRSSGADSKSGGGDVGSRQSSARAAIPSSSGDNTLTSSPPGKVIGCLDWIMRPPSSPFSSFRKLAFHESPRARISLDNASPSLEPRMSEGFRW
ncbi:hypothetical protein D3C77_567800 [compost metagenome]